MKTTMTRQGAYLGAGAGLVLFALFGLLPGSLLRGAAGIKFAGMFFGLPLDPGLLSRLVVLSSMFAGVAVSWAAIVTASSALGWLVGAAFGTAERKNILAAIEKRNADPASETDGRDGSADAHRSLRRPDEEEFFKAQVTC